ncbi:MAG: SPOR domain-containing protein [Pseudomonadota bacterium]
MSVSTVEEEYDDFDEFDDDDDEDQGFSGLLVLVMGALLFGALVLVVWIAYNHGVKMGEARNDPPFVAADPDPVKIENKDVAATEGADREVFDRYEGRDQSDVAVIASDTTASTGGGGSTNPLTGVGSAGGGSAAMDAVSDRIEKLADGTKDQAKDAVKYVKAAGPSEGQTATAAVKEVVKKPAPVAKPKPSAPAAPATSSSGALSGTHVVQVAALGSRAEADASWAKIKKKLGTYADGKSPNIIAPLNDKDVYYRLRIGPFTSKDAASKYCAGLKERGQTCLVRAK